MRRLDDWLCKQSIGIIISLCTLLFLLVTAADLATSPQISTSIYYVAPIALASWYANRLIGFALAFLAGSVWLVKDALVRGAPYTEQWIPFWNTGARLAIFALIAYLVAEVHELLRRERQLARTDALTQVFNRRSFHEMLTLEFERLNRSGQPLSIAYIDIDNFKTVNDTHGHDEGDQVLRTVSEILRAELRKTDVVARLGGDEFAVLLTDSNSDDARQAIEKLLSTLHGTVAARKWPIGFSIGLITCESQVDDPEEIIRLADQAMYQVKSARTNQCLHFAWRPEGIVKISWGGQ